VALSVSERRYNKYTGLRDVANLFVYITRTTLPGSIWHAIPA